MKPLSVVHIIGALPVGGVERNLARVLPMLDRDRFQVSVICLRELGELAPQLQQVGIPVSLSFMKNRYHPGSLLRLAKRLRAAEAKIVHCHMRRANTSGRLAAMLARVPVRLAHERDLGLGKKARHYFVDRLLGYFNSPIICVTRGVAEHNFRHSGLPREKFVVQYNGIDLAPFLQERNPQAEKARYGLPVDRPVIGFVGRLHEIKDLPLLLQAFANLQVSGPAPCLALVGEGREKAALLELAKSIGISERTIFLPWQHDLPSVYSALDVFVLPSRSEGIANVQLEAVAAGVPLVSTRVGIAAEAFTEGRDFIAVESSAEAIARGIQEALQPEHAAELAAAGREAVKAFTLEQQRDNLTLLYEKLWQEYNNQQ
ncbi:MAG: glycosyltransferase [Planctomycetes bacterium]|nr:glycosyltransferase [Planctomycetota bacterium]